MLYGIDPLASWLLATLAFALAGAALAAAFIEAPPPTRMPRAAIVLAGAWAATFFAAAVLARPLHDLLVAALFVSAAQLAAAAAIWLARGRVRGDDGGGGGSPGPSQPHTVPEDCWQRWEEQFDSVRGAPAP